MLGIRHCVNPSISSQRDCWSFGYAPETAQFLSQPFSRGNFLPVTYYLVRPAADAAFGGRILDEILCGFYATFDVGIF